VNPYNECWLLLCELEFLALSPGPRLATIRARLDELKPKLAHYQRYRLGQAERHGVPHYVKDLLKQWSRDALEAPWELLAKWEFRDQIREFQNPQEVWDFTPWDLRERFARRVNMAREALDLTYVLATKFDKEGFDDDREWEPIAKQFYRAKAALCLLGYLGQSYCPKEREEYYHDIRVAVFNEHDASTENGSGEGWSEILVGPGVLQNWYCYTQDDSSI
jgi:hypothetical protein